MPLSWRRRDRRSLQNRRQRLCEDVFLPMPPPEPRQPQQNEMRYLRKRYCPNTVSTRVKCRSINHYPLSQVSPTTSGTIGVQPATPFPAPPAYPRSAPILPPTDIRCTSRALSSATSLRSPISTTSIGAIGAGSTSSNICIRVSSVCAVEIITAVCCVCRRRFIRCMRFVRGSPPDGSCALGRREGRMERGLNVRREVCAWRKLIATIHIAYVDSQ